MLSYNAVVVYCVLILCAEVVISKEGEKKLLKEEAELKHTFAKLLNTIITVNEGRMQTMKRMTRLQDYMLTKNKLKTDDDVEGSMEEDDNRILLAFADMPHLRRTLDETITRPDRFNLEKKYVHFVNELAFEEGLSQPRHKPM